MSYDVIFDLAQEGYRTWWFPAHGLVLMVCGLGLVKFRARLPAHGPAWVNRYFPFVFLTFMTLWTLGAIWSTYTEYMTLTAALRAGNVQIVEGMVSAFSPQPKEGKRNESFCVAGRCFFYSAFNVTNAYNRTATNGGVIKDGLFVRIHHVDGRIVRLEIKR
jgi:hypothetical protein